MKLLKVFALLGLSSYVFAGPSQPPSGNYIQSRSTLQSGATFYVSSGTVNTLTISTINVNGAGQGYLLLYSSTVYFISVASATTQANYVPTLTAITLTPKRTTSRIEVSWIGHLTTAAGTGANAFASIFRNTTNLAPSGGTDLCSTDSNIAGSARSTCSGNVIDLPNTISATTYTVYIRNDSEGTAVTWGGLSTSGAAITVKEWGY